MIKKYVINKIYNFKLLGGEKKIQQNILMLT